MKKKTGYKKPPSIHEYDDALTTFIQARALVQTTYDALGSPSDVDTEAMSWTLSMALEKFDDVKNIFDRIEPGTTRNEKAA